MTEKATRSHNRVALRNKERTATLDPLQYFEFENVVSFILSVMLSTVVFPKVVSGISAWFKSHHGVNIPHQCSKLVNKVFNFLILASEFLLKRNNK